jgi:hypothetical protein
VDLLFGGVEGEVADVERGCVFELVFGGGGASAEVVVAGIVAVASALLIKNIVLVWGLMLVLRALLTFAVA